MTGRLQGKVVLISGGARGQGAAEARTFCTEGAKVVFGDVLDVSGASDAAREARIVVAQGTFVRRIEASSFRIAQLARRAAAHTSAVGGSLGYGARGLHLHSESLKKYWSLEFHQLRRLGG